MITEINPSIMHRANQLQVLYYLSEFHHNQKLFKMTRADVVEYLDSCASLKNQILIINGKERTICAEYS
jgi:hypothetical protein